MAPRLDRAPVRDRDRDLRPADHHPLRPRATSAAALWAVIHEVGHALYENGLDPALERTPLCRSVSLGFDESQSRLWENWVGRGRPFMSRLLPMLATRFGEPFDGLGPNELYRAANVVSAVADPGRGRRGHLQPAHRSCGSSSSSRSSTARWRSPTCPRPGTRACASTSGSRSPTTPTGCSRTSTGRRRLRLLPDLLARQRDRGARSGSSHARRSATSTRSSPPASSRRCARSWPSASTATAASSSRRR